ncbi:mucin-21-like isoform X1 [Amia ocellicauda]|uniref:mucin-21-like isoform X1 n=1 Tax=Amia ocellicauda TaxID=2972642 RepID=UPI003463B745
MRGASSLSTLLLLLTSLGCERGDSQATTSSFTESQTPSSPSTHAATRTAASSSTATTSSSTESQTPSSPSTPTTSSFTESQTPSSPITHATTRTAASSSTGSPGNPRRENCNSPLSWSIRLTLTAVFSIMVTALLYRAHRDDIHQCKGRKRPPDSSLDYENVNRASTAL